MQRDGSSSFQFGDMASFAAQPQHQHMQPQQGSGDAAEDASPISSRPPPARGDSNEMRPAAGGFPEDESLAGEEAEQVFLSGNRWPRQETLALLQIRSEMDVVFREATLKGPLWEEVSRKLEELGYRRSAKKCREKFENVHKYYKRTKDGRAGRQDGKSYRFFSQLEALHGSAGSISTPNPTMASAAAPIGANSLPPPSSSRIQPPPTSDAVAQMGIQQVRPDFNMEPSLGMPAGSPAAATAVPARAISFSTSTSTDSEEEELEEAPLDSSRKRKRSHGSRPSGESQKMMAFFEGLMSQVMEKQEAMQQRFLDAIEKREQDRMIREEAWKRQEMARLTREHEMLAQERATAASRDAAIIAFLQKLTGQTIQIPQLVAIPAMPAAAAPPPPAQPKPDQNSPRTPAPQQLILLQPAQTTQEIRHPVNSRELVVIQPPEQQLEMGGGFDQVSSSRWPKEEVLALISLRSGLEPRYQEAGPKGPLWEEISAAMGQLGFNRSAKRCKEKWENINKYFKKVKESNKKRPEDAKTCPYFHQLDALYKKKILGGEGGGGGSGSSSSLNLSSDPQEKNEVLAIMPPPPSNPAPPSQALQGESDSRSKSSSFSVNNSGRNNEGGSSSSQVETTNGVGFPSSSFFAEDPLKKPEDVVKEEAAMDAFSFDSGREEDDCYGSENGDDGDDDEDDGTKMTFRIQFQTKNPGSSSGRNPSGSFLALVQ